MAGLISLTDTPNPLAQTIRIAEPGGVTLTAISLYFYSKSSTFPITLELRPMVNGVPSSTRFAPGTRVTLNPGSVNADTTWNATETKFTFDAPIYVPTPVEFAIVLYTNASVGDYKLWLAELGEFVYDLGSSTPSTTTRVSVQPAVGSLFESSNGTTWTARQDKDLAYKIYKAKFTYENTYAAFNADFPPLKNLGPDPFTFDGSTSSVKVFDAGHGFLVGDKVNLSLISGGSYSTTAGIAEGDLSGNRTITAADVWGYTITAGSSSTGGIEIRGGGEDWLVSQQHKFTSFQLHAPMINPANTSHYVVANFTEFADVMDDDGSLTGNSVWGSSGDVAIQRNKIHAFNAPFVLADSNQEISELSGNPSMKIFINMNTANENVSPAINLTSMSARISSVFVDYQDSDAAPATDGRNYVTTLDFVPESHPVLGTSAAKHVTIPFNLATSNAATSIRVLVDAIRPNFSDFDVWYRVWNRDQNSPHEVEWVLFSKTKEGPNTSNYEDTPAGFELNEYEFSVFDLPVFDTYQIKIVMKAGNSANFPKFKNLRTIATI
jgi:hypothetical protein